jgi:hypothetical protein
MIHELYSCKSALKRVMFGFFNEKIYFLHSCIVSSVSAHGIFDQTAIAVIYH